MSHYSSDKVINLLAGKSAYRSRIKNSDDFNPNIFIDFLRILKLFKIFRNITQIYIMKIYLFHILLNIIKELLKLALTLLYVSIVNIFMKHLYKVDIRRQIWKLVYKNDN